MSRQALELTPVAAAADTPEHRRFARLQRELDAARQRLAAWQQHLPAFIEAYRAQLRPLLLRLAAARRAWAFELEQLLLSRKWSRAEQATLQRLICELARAGLADTAADAELLALHDRHAEQDLASARQQARQEMEAFVAQAQQLPDEAEPPRPPRKTRSKAQARAEAEAREATQTVREVYRRLAAALHPDRAAPEVQALRHEQMARANAAYAAGDLLALLTLQLEIEQLDAARASQLAASKVKHFNRVLAEQLREIEDEILEREHAFLGGFGMAPTQRPHPEKLGQILKREMADALAAEAALQREQRTLRGDVASVRRWLKSLEQQYRYEDRFGTPLPF